MMYDSEMDEYGSDRSTPESTAVATAGTLPQRVQHDQADGDVHERQRTIEELRQRREALLKYALSLAPEMA